MSSKHETVRLLIVEDQQPFQLVFDRILKKLTTRFEGISITVTKRLDECLRIVAETPQQDIVILDLTLEDSVMENTLKYIEEIEQHSALIIVTGYSPELVRALITKSQAHHDTPREYAILQKDEGLWTKLLQAIVKALSLRAEKRYLEQRARLAAMESIVKCKHVDERESH